MGLDTSYDCWNGPYSSFHAWRVEVARAAGINLNSMCGFSYKAEGTKWEALKPDAIHILLDHSDCDGEIAASDTLKLAERLEELLPLIEDERWVSKTKTFIDGLREAHANNDVVEFM